MINVQQIVFFISIILLILFLLTGCTRVEYKPVPVPVKCEITLKEKPTTSRYDVNYLKSVLIYADEMECDLHFCVTGEVKKNCKINKKEEK